MQITRAKRVFVSADGKRRMEDLNEGTVEDALKAAGITLGENDTVTPGGNDSLHLYDLAYFMTTKQYIPYIRKIVGKEHYVDVKNVMIMGGGATAVRAVKTMPEYMDVKIIEPSRRRETG